MHIFQYIGVALMIGFVPTEGVRCKNSSLFNSYYKNAVCSIIKFKQNRML